MKKKLFILLGLCIALILIILKPWSISDLPVKKPVIGTGNNKGIKKRKPRTAEDRVAAYLAAVRGKRGLLIDSNLFKLGNLRDPGLVEPLLKRLGDKDPMARVFAAYALGRTGDSRAIEPLLKVLDRRKVKDYASVYAAEALGNFNDPRIIEPLIAALEDPYYEVRGFAASSLGKMKAKQAEVLLTKKLKDPHHFVRQRAAFGLQAMKAVSRVDSLAMALKKETNSNNKESLTIRLGETGDPAAVQPLLDALLNAPEPLVRINAAYALREIKDSAAIAPMSEALKKEKDAHVKSWIFSDLKALKEARQYGKLRFLNGQPVPSILYFPVKNREQKILKIQLPDFSGNKSQYCLSTANNLQQHIDKNGFIHLVTPFSRPVAVEDCGDFVFVLHEWHCEVLYKGENRWQVFTLSDGYLPQEFELKAENYENHVVFRDLEDQQLPVLHFNKTKRLFAFLPVAEYNLQKTQWKSLRIDETKKEWFLKNSALMRRDLTSGREAPLTVPSNSVTDIVSSGGKLFVSSGESIRVFEQGRESQFLNAQNQLYSNSIRTLRGNGSKLLVLYKDNIDIFDTTANIKLVSRFAFPELNTNGSYNTPVIDFNSYGLFYALGGQFIAEELGSWKKRFDALFNARISGILHYKSQVLIQTPIGFSVYKPDTGEITNFYENKLQQKEIADNDYEYYFLEPVGISENYYIYIERIGINMPAKLCFFNFKTHRVESSGYHLPGCDLTKSFVQLQGVYFENGYTMALDFGDDPMDRFLKSFRIFSPEESTKPVVTASLSKNTAMPSRGPCGTSIRDFDVLEKDIWLGTDFGLFSFNRENKLWQSHYTGSNLFNIKDLVVTGEGIYAFGAKTGNSQLSHWCRIDRNTFGSEFISDRGIKGESHSIRLHGDRIIYASPMGIGIFDPVSRTDTIMTTPKPINFAGIYGNKYLGVNQRYLYILDSDGKLLETVSLRDLGDDPLDFGITGHEALITSDDYLIRVNMETLEQIRIPLSLASDPVKVVSGTGLVPLIIFQRDNIYGHQKESGGGLIFRFSGPFSNSNRIITVLEQGNLIYIGSEKGLYRLNKTNWELQEACFKPGDINSITSCGEFYFLASDSGIYQIHQSLMNDMFDCSEIKFETH